MVSDEDVHSLATAEEEEAIKQNADGSASGYWCVVPAPDHVPKPWAAIMNDDKLGVVVTHGYFECAHTAVLWLLRRLDHPSDHDGSKKAKHTP